MQNRPAHFMQARRISEKDLDWCCDWYLIHGSWFQCTSSRETSSPLGLLEGTEVYLVPTLFLTRGCPNERGRALWNARLHFFLSHNWVYIEKHGNVCTQCIERDADLWTCWTCSSEQFICFAELIWARNRSEAKYDKYDCLHGNCTLPSACTSIRTATCWMKYWMYFTFLPFSRFWLVNWKLFVSRSKGYASSSGLISVAQQTRHIGKVRLAYDSQNKMSVWTQSGYFFSWHLVQTFVEFLFISRVDRSLGLWDGYAHIALSDQQEHFRDWERELLKSALSS